MGGVGYTHRSWGAGGGSPQVLGPRACVCACPVPTGELNPGGRKVGPPPPSPQPYRALLVCTNRALWGCSALLGESWAKGGVCGGGGEHPSRRGFCCVGRCYIFSFILIHWINSALIEPLCPQSSAGWGVRGEVPEAAVGEAGGSAVGLRRGGGAFRSPLGRGQHPVCLPTPQ